MISYKDSYKDKSALFVSILLFSLGNPFFLWNIPQRPVFIMLMQLVLLFICNHNKTVMSSKDRYLSSLYIFTFVYWLYITIYNGVLNLNGIIINLVISLFFMTSFVSSDFREKVIKNYTMIYACIIGVSLFFWFLALNGLISSIGTINHYNESLSREYTVFPFVVIEHMDVINGIRFAGIYDEPGVVGTLGGLLLIINRFNFKDWRNLVILFSCLFSLSFFFYLVITIYLLLYLWSKAKYTHLIALLLILGSFYFLTQNNSVVKSRIWERLEWNEESEMLAGDNRMVEEGELYYERIKGTSEFYFGVNNIQEYWRVAHGSSSYKNVIAMYGVIFLFLYCLYFFLPINKPTAIKTNDMAIAIITTIPVLIPVKRKDE